MNRIREDKLRKIIREEILKERSIGLFKYGIDIRVNIEMTNHATERQRDRGITISDNQIKNAAKKAIPHISRMLLTDELDVYDEFVITDTDSGLGVDLNLVATIEPEDRAGESFELRGITVMAKNNFKPTKESKQIFV